MVFCSSVFFLLGNIGCFFFFDLLVCKEMWRRQSGHVKAFSTFIWQIFSRVFTLAYNVHHLNDNIQKKEAASKAGTTDWSCVNCALSMDANFIISNQELELLLKMGQITLVCVEIPSGFTTSVCECAFVYGRLLITPVDKMNTLRYFILLRDQYVVYMPISRSPS